MKRGETGRLRRAVLASVVIHVGLTFVAWTLTSRGEELPPMRAYAVSIVSPPPQSFGEPRPAEPQVVPEPQAEAEVEPEVAPEPEPEPTPAPPPPPPPPSTAPRQATPPPPPPPPPPRQETAEPRPSQPAQQPAASTGRQPDPSSSGGENITAQLRGVQCPTPEYCNNIIRQINRYFRSPGAGAAAEADVYFQINRDGSITDLRLISSTGGPAFRLAVMEAVEQAGINRAFGPLPQPYQADQLPVSFYFRPTR